MSEEGAPKQFGKKFPGPENSPEELDWMRHLLLTDCEGYVGSRRAYDESEKLPVQFFIVFDALKWVEDEIGKSANRQLFQDLAKQISAITNAAYNLYNDGFVVQARTREDAESVIRCLRERLSMPLLGAAFSDGTTIERRGVEFMYGIGDTLDDAEADLRERRKKIPGRPWWWSKPKSSK